MIFITITFYQIMVPLFAFVNKQNIKYLISSESSKLEKHLGYFPLRYIDFYIHQPGGSSEM